MATQRRTRFSRRLPDHVTDEIVKVMSNNPNFYKFNDLFGLVYENLKAKNAVSGGEEMLRLRAYEKLQNLVNRGLVEKKSPDRTYKGLAGIENAHSTAIAAAQEIAQKEMAEQDKKDEAAREIAAKAAKKKKEEAAAAKAQRAIETARKKEIAAAKKAVAAKEKAARAEAAAKKKAAKKAAKKKAATKKATKKAAKKKAAKPAPKKKVAKKAAKKTTKKAAKKKVARKK